MEKHAFNEAVDTVLGECIEVSNTRGIEYQDTWKLENVSTPFLDATLEVYDGFPRDKRLVLLAALIDVKLSRMRGEYKEDTILDLINYLAAYAYFRRK